MNDPHRPLLSQAAEGDDDALAELYRAFESRIYAFGMSRLNDPAAAADLVNEVMIEIWKNARRFEGRSTVATWILSIARHRILDELRRRGRRQFDELDPAQADEAQVNAEEVMASAGDTEALKECLDKLPDPQREAVHLAFFEDLSYGEVAGVAGCPEGTVKTRIFHARRALKRCLRARII